jgi:hypothetical protein
LDTKPKGIIVLFSFFSLDHQPELDTAAMMPEAEGKNCADVALFSWQALQTVAFRISYQVSL